MRNIKQRWSIWMALVAVGLVPVSVLAVKRVYHTNLKDAMGAGHGSAVVMLGGAGADYIVRTTGLPGYQVQYVYLEEISGAWGPIALCRNGAPAADDCTYAANGSGNLDLEGAITGQMLAGAGLTPPAFLAALDAGRIRIAVNDFGTDLAWGVLTRIL